MPIGEFGGAPPLAAEGSPALTTPMYWMYELAQASLNPARAVIDATKILFQNPLNPWTHTNLGKSIAAGCELFERATRRYGKPEWNLPTTEVNGVRTPVEVRSNSLTFSARSTAATCCEMPDWVAFSRSAARVNEPSSHTATTARICRRLTSDIRKPDALSQNILFRMRAASS